MNQQYHHPDNLVKVEGESDKLKKWLFHMFNLWPWVLLSLIICISLSYFYLLYTQPVYRAVASLLIRDETKEANRDISRLKEIGVTNNSKLVVNEIEVLKSYDLIARVVDSLDLFISVKQKGKLNYVSVFGDEVPFIIDVINPEAIIKPKSCKIFYEGNKMFLERDNKKQRTLLKYNQTYNDGDIKFIYKPSNRPFGQANLTTNKINETYKVYLNPPDETTIQTGSALQVEPANKLATVINLQIKDDHGKRAKAILQTLLFIYNQQGVELKNKITESTIAFLNDRLVGVADELRAVEGTVEKIKTANKITSLSSDAEKYMETSQQVDIQKAQTLTQLNIINALEQDFLQNQGSPKIVPSTFGIQDPSLDQLINKHNELVLQRERLQKVSGPKNPLLIEQDSQLKELGEKLLANVRNLKKAYSISLDNISRKDAQLSNRIRNVPQLEKKLIQITRSQNVQESLYSYLLQKREEAVVSRAANIEDAQIILNARNLGPISPNKKIILCFGFIIGLILPLSVFGIKDFINNKVGDIQQVEQYTGLTVVGVISHVKKFKAPLIIDPHTQTPVADQIRSIRTAITLLGNDKSLKTILVTSFCPGDGKSFVSMNLAAGFALLNGKVVILECDLRKPSISKELEINDQEGVSGILKGGQNMDDLFVQIAGYNNNLYLLPSGYRPPNSAELLAGSEMSNLICQLKERFEYIIIDTPSYGIVSDASLLQQYADMILFVLRQGHTPRDVFVDLQQWNNKYPSSHEVYLLLNDVTAQQGYQKNKHYYK